MQAEIEEIQAEAREGFDFRARLANANNRRRVVTVYTDAAIGEKIGYAVDEELPGGIKTGRRTRKGLAGKLDALYEEAEALNKHFDFLEESGQEIPDVDVARVKEIKAQIGKIEKELAAVRKDLESTAFEFHLISLPSIADRKARREAKVALGIKGKNIPEAKADDFNAEFASRLIAASVEKWVDRQTGVTYTGITPEQVNDLRDWLPIGQYARIDTAVSELSFQAAIADGATDNADF
ncbi:hypothetical protein [Microbacterium sp.]|uniref:hypothetical protein n=1 Tax=Microbacterium sp. TaxID=51671 RepID=UPI0039E45A22